MLPGVVTTEWAYGDGRGHGVRVAVVDSGIDADHPAVGGVAGAVEVLVDDDDPDDVTVVEGPHEDLYGHGTACAGLVRAVAPEVELISVRVLGAEPARERRRLRRRHRRGASTSDVEVVNLSLSTSNVDYLPTFWALVDRAAFAGVLLVSAMNNERKRTIPSEFAGVFSVAAGPGRDLEAVWCNPAGPAEWGAAGIDLEVAWKGGGWVVASGNSFSAAVVTGHLARVVAAHPGLSPWQARTVLAAVAVNARIARAAEPGRSDDCALTAPAGRRRSSVSRSSRCPPLGPADLVLGDAPAGRAAVVQRPVVDGMALDGLVDVLLGLGQLAGVG